MNWESLAWVAIALASVPVARLIEPRWRTRWPKTWPPVQALAPWIYGLGPAYLALVRGAVLARPYGLYGRGGIIGWLLSGMVCAVLLVMVHRLRGRMAGKAGDVDLLSSLLDEPRWALYRAAGIQWLGGWGLLAGLMVGAVEWTSRTEIWEAKRRKDPATWTSLVRLCVSTVLFAITGNVWLTLATQAGGWLIIDRAAGEREAQA